MHIVVFFTFGVSLKLWKETGLIGRELLSYKKYIDEGHKVTLLTYGDKDDLECCSETGTINVVPVYSFSRRPGNRVTRLLQSFFIPFYFRKLFISADICKTNQMMGAWVPLLVKLLYRKKMVVRCGYEFFRNLVRDRSDSIKSIFAIVFAFLMEIIIYRFADKIIISSLTDRDFICRVFHISPDKITLLRNFIDVDLFCPQETGKSENAILYIGRLNKRKNILSLIKALEGTSIRLDIIGDGDQKDVLEDYALKKGVDVHFLGTFQNNELPKYINRYNAYILPSLYENNPKTLLEAMSCGIAVIGTNVEGIRELIKNKDNGLLCEIDSISIKNAISTLMDNKDLKEKLGENARRFVVNNCSLEVIYNKEVSIYKRLNYAIN